MCEDNFVKSIVEVKRGRSEFLSWLSERISMPLMLALMIRRSPQSSEKEVFRTLSNNESESRIKKRGPLMEGMRRR